MKKIKGSKGITLVALVITIIILLLLAGIAIGQLTKNGLFEQTKLAKQESINSQELENSILLDYEKQINELGGSSSNWVNVTEIFDNTGEIEGKLHIGDFINYTAGDWTEEEIISIGANNSASMPYQSYQFGGFVTGDSRNGNGSAILSDLDLIREKVTGEKVTGWRLFDVTDDGTLILLSAGCPEYYYIRNRCRFK